MSDDKAQKAMDGFIDRVVGEVEEAGLKDEHAAPPLSIEGREEFEKWVREKTAIPLARFAEPHAYIYCDGRTEFAWQGWQASRASDRERARIQSACSECDGDGCPKCCGGCRGLQGELQRYLDSTADVHAVLDAAGIPKAAHVPCDDPKCQSHIGHRTRVLASQLSKLTGLLKRVMAHGVPHARSCVMTFPATAQGLNPGATCGCGADDIRVALLSHLESSQ